MYWFVKAGFTDHNASLDLYRQQTPMYKWTPTLCVKVDTQILEDVHVSRVNNGGHTGGETLAVDMLDGLRPYIQH